MIKIRLLSHSIRLFAVLLLATFGSLTALAQTQSTAFTYQGKLQDSGSPANGTYDLGFQLWDSLTGGHPALAPCPTARLLTGVQVTNGTFTVRLDFYNGVNNVCPSGGNPFPGADRYLEISVRPHSDDPNIPAYTTLSPRQLIASVPYALRSGSAASADTATSATTANSATTATNATQLGGVAANQYVLTGDSRLTDARSPTAGSLLYVQNGTSQQPFTSFNISGNATAGGIFTGNGSGLTNVPGTLSWQTVAGTSQQAQVNTGYLATNASQTTITLPSSPNFGDIVRVSGSGAGGWKIAQGNGQSILGTNLALIGASWLFNPYASDWRSVASSADGTKLATVSFGGHIYTSIDSGVVWTEQANSGNQNWLSIASSANGSRLVAVVSGGHIYTSSDSGLNWTARDSLHFWQGVASSADGSKLVAVAIGGSLSDPGLIYTSTDYGVNWTARTNFDSHWSAVASSSDGTNLVAVSLGNPIYTSADSGASWVSHDDSRNWSSVASSSDGTKLVAVVSGGQIYTSIDSGLSWTPRETNRQWTSVASSSDGNRLVATVSGGPIFTSADAGVTWTARATNFLFVQWSSVASSFDGTKLVAVSHGPIYTSSPNTTPGTAGYLTGGQSSAIELQYIGNGLWLPLSHEGTFTGN